MDVLPTMLIVGFVFFLLFLPIFLPKIIYRRDTSKTRSPRLLRRDAKIVDISSRKVGVKGDYKFETCIIYDDGFIYYSYDTERKDYFFHYTISVTEYTTEAIIVRANRAHECACDAAGIPDEFVCGNCGHQGPYAGNCPQCGSNLKRYTS